MQKTTKRMLLAARPLVVAFGLVAALAGPAAAAPTWLAPQNLSTSPATGNPVVASDGANESFAAWNRSDGAHLVVQVASHAPGLPWSAASDLTPGGQDANAPSISVSSSGFGAIAFTRSNGTHVVTMVSRRVPGGPFMAPESISTATVDAGATAAVAVDAAGDVVVVWADATKQALHARRFSAAGNAWGAITDLATAPANESIGSPSLVISPSGIATAAWLFDTDASATVSLQVQSRTQELTGTWGTMTPLTALTAPEQAGPPRLAVDNADNVTLVSFQYRLATATSYAEAIVFEASRPGASEVWQTPQVLSDSNLNSDSPQVATTPSGDVTVAWTELTSDSIKTVSRPAGGAFPAAGAATSIVPNDRSVNSGIDPSGTPYTSLRLVSGAQGTVAVFGRSDGVNLLAEAVARPAGGAWPNPATTAPTMLSAPGTDIGLLDSPGLALDGSGNAVATWILGTTIQAAAYDVSPPSFTSVTVPATGTTGQPIPMSAAAVDTWSALASGQPTWSFGDTNLGAGASVTHIYAAPGTYTVSAGVSDAVGNPAAAVTRTIVIANPVIPPLPPTTIAKPRLKAVWKANKLVASVAISGTVPVSTTLTAAVQLRGAKKPSVSVRFAAKIGAWSHTLKLPSGLAPGTYTVTVTGNGITVAQTTFALAAPKTGIVKHSYATAQRTGPAVTTLRKASQLWAHFQFGTLPKKGQKITTQWILPNGHKLSANTRPRTVLVEAQVKDLSGKPLPTGRWRCVIRVGSTVLVTLNVRLR